MTAKQLTDSILQLAIQGKLVPQNPNDEPASVLLDRIREEKKQLYKQGLLKKKELEERTVSEDEVNFQIPDNWIWTKIDNIAFVTKLAGFEYTKYIAENLVSKEYGVPLFKGKNVQNGKIVYEFEGYIPLELSNELKRSQINKKCLLTPYVGTIGNIGIHNREGIFHLGSNVGKIEFYNGSSNILEEYAKYYLMSSFGYDELTKYKKATAQESISIEAIRDVVIPVPPYNEQVRIAERIDKLLAIVKDYGKANDVLEQMNAELPENLKKSILQEAIMGKLGTQDPNDEPASVLLDRIREEKKQLVKAGLLKKKDIEETPIEDCDIPYDIPETWTWVRLQDVTTYISRGKSPVYSEIKKYPIVAQKCNQWAGFSLEKAKFADPKTIEKYAEERQLKDGDLLWNSTGLGTLGRMAIYNSSVNPYGWAAADSHVTVIRTIPDFADYKFLYYYFASPIVQSVIEDKSDGSTKQKELAQETVRKYEVPLPPLAEQHRIVEKIEALFAEVDHIEI